MIPSEPTWVDREDIVREVGLGDMWDEAQGHGRWADNVVRNVLYSLAMYLIDTDQAVVPRDVRSQVAQDIAAAIENAMSPKGLSKIENLQLEHAARIAREVGTALERSPTP